MLGIQIRIQFDKFLARKLHMGKVIKNLRNFG